MSWTLLEVAFANGDAEARSWATCPEIEGFEGYRTLEDVLNDGWEPFARERIPQQGHLNGGTIWWFKRKST